LGNLRVIGINIAILVAYNIDCSMILMGRFWGYIAVVLQAITCAVIGICFVIGGGFKQSVCFGYRFSCFYHDIKSYHLEDLS